MKRINQIIWLFAICNLILSTACGTVLASITGSNTKAAIPGASQSGGGEIEMTQTQKLALGIIKLEDSSQPVTAEQAGQLVMLWKALRNIAAEDTAVNAEKNALIKQIQGTLTTSQQEAIVAMDLDVSSMSEVADKLGVQVGGGMGSLTTAQRATLEAAMSNGSFDPGTMGGGPGGVPPMGGGTMGEMGGFPGMQDSDSAVSLSTGSGLGMPDQLVEALIQFLVERSNSGE